MTANRVTRPRSRQQIVTGTLTDATPQAVSRLIGDIVSVLPGPQTPRTQQVVSLVVGDNHINHGLGRKAIGASVTPTVVDPAFAWGFAAPDTLTVTITVVNVAQPNACVECF